MRFLEAKAYNDKNEEIEVPENHCMLVDSLGNYSFVKMNYPEKEFQNLVYQPERLNEKTPLGDAKV